ncbi:MAG: hypothetical protein OJF49_001402 [Ktedonobacterales bacterium]|jgi:hypothetical protein|nr:MAG: hypothetical protein OJF49_001402 [Ktedonobacterales bacterium]
MNIALTSAVLSAIVFLLGAFSVLSYVRRYRRPEPGDATISARYALRISLVIMLYGLALAGYFGMQYRQSLARASNGPPLSEPQAPIPSPTFSPTLAPTATLTVTPQGTATRAATATPAKATATPTKTATATATISPTATSTPSPTPTDTPTPTPTL